MWEKSKEVGICRVFPTGAVTKGLKGDEIPDYGAMKEAGATNIAQDERSCVVFGMPKEAIKQGGVDDILPLEAIAGRILSLS